MTRIESIRTTVETILKEAGFSTVQKLTDRYSVKFMKDGLLSLVENKSVGLELSVWEVFKHNGTEENVSVNIDIINWGASTGKYVYKGKNINSSWSEKRIKNEVAKAIEAYRI